MSNDEDGSPLESSSLERPLLSSSSHHRQAAAPHLDLEEQLQQPPTTYYYDDEQLLGRPAVGNRQRTRNSGNSSNTAVLRQRRILDRDAAFFQSQGRWSVRHVSRGEARLMQTPQGGERRREHFTRRFWNDWFHMLVYQETVVLVLILFFFYAAIIFVFASIYLFVSLGGATTTKLHPDDGSTKPQLHCDMDIHNHMEALYFSLSTMTTIGYGVSDYYFGGCVTPLVLVLMQVWCALLFNAVAIGAIFQRISRGHQRSKSILFSDRATIRRVGGVPHLYIRLAELRHYHLLEATVRAYCIRHERHWDDHDGTGAAAVMETTHFVTKPMKLVHETVGSHIMMSLPQVVVHRMDSESPLVCPPGWYDVNGQQHVGVDSSSSIYQTHRQWNNHGQAGFRISDEESSLASSIKERDLCFLREMKEIKSFLRDRETEIVILMEGTDELTGAVIQTRHSYTCDELVWNERFAPCTYTYSEYLARDDDGETTVSPTTFARERLLNLRSRRIRGDPPFCVVDFARFHETLPAPLDSESCPYT